jgi:excisionase family DNA binding protein
MENMLLVGINGDQLLERIGQLIDSKLSKIAPPTHEKQSKFITRQEVAGYLKISLPTLNEWTKLGWLQSYKVGSRVLYKLEEVEASINKLATYKFTKGGNHA